MRSIIILIMGIIFICTGVFVYFVVGNAFADVSAEFGVSNLKELLQNGVGGLFAIIGTIMAITGVLGLSRGVKKSKQDKRIAQLGTEAEATVTFVDKNYSFLVNNRPIYSIVEYSYKDNMGQEHTNRIEDFNSETVIRNKIEVGSSITIKYLDTDPGNSVIIL